MIIDAHTHTFPDSISLAVIDKLKRASHIEAYTDGRLKNLIRSMDNAGIEYSIVLPVATNPEKVSHINDFSNAIKNDRVCYFGAMHPECPYWEVELKRIKKLGFPGIKIHPVYQGVDINDKKFLRILYKAAELDLAVITHAGKDIGYPGVEHCTPKMISDAVRQIGKFKFVLAHLGGWKSWDDVKENLVGLPVYFDTAFTLGNFKSPDNTYKDSQLNLLGDEQFVELIKLLGYKNIIFGSDSPWGSQRESVNRFLRLPLNDDIKQQIMCDNAVRILNLNKIGIAEG